MTRLPQPNPEFVPGYTGMFFEGYKKRDIGYVRDPDNNLLIVMSVRWTPSPESEDDVPELGGEHNRCPESTRTGLLCWRPAGHAGRHWDRADGLFWQQTGTSIEECIRRLQEIASEHPHASDGIG